MNVFGFALTMPSMLAMLSTRFALSTIVAGIDVTSYELPRMAGGIDLGGLYELAALLREQMTGTAEGA